MSTQTNKRVIETGQEARDSLKRGIDFAANIVKKTLGPGGQNVIMGIKGGTPTITNDGISILKEIFLPNEIEDLGVRTLREAALRTVDAAGDGTTTVTVLTQAIIDVALPQTKSAGIDLGDTQPDEKVNAVAIKNQIITGGNEVIEALKAMAKPVKSQEELYKVALVSSESTEIAKAVSEGLWEVGKTGFLGFQEGYTGSIEKEVVSGLTIDSGMAERWMVNNEYFECVLEDAYVLVTDHVARDISHEPSNWLQVVCNSLASQGKKELVILARTFGDDLVAAAFHNIAKKGFRLLLIRSPYMYEKYVMQDLAMYTGGTFIDQTMMKLSDVRFEHLGRVKKVVARKDETAFIGGFGKTEVIKDAIGRFEAELKKEHMPTFKRELEKRMARLSGSIGMIRVGAPSETERKYLMDKVEDTISATKAAWAEGVIPGGGLALKKISEKLPEGHILKKVLLAPYKQIQENAGGKLEIGKDVIDPVKVTRICIEKACSVAGLIITTDAAINHEFDKPKCCKSDSNDQSQA
jgi:chaperonin GroEL